MKYADQQIVRPQHEGGCDYGHGRRSVLVQNGKKQILHIGNAKHWGGIGAQRYGSNVEIVAYPSKDDTCRQKTLYPTDAELKVIQAAGKKVIIGRKQFEQIATQMFEHLGIGFDLKLISLKHTLLLDVEGEVDGPPPRDPTVKKIHPRIESDTIYRIFHEDNVCKVVKCPIIKQGGGKITYRLKQGQGREVTRPTKQLLEEGCGGTLDEAVEGYLQEYKKSVVDATERLTRAADNYSYNSDRLIEAKHRIEEMLKEPT